VVGGCREAKSLTHTSKLSQATHEVASILKNTVVAIRDSTQQDKEQIKHEKLLELISTSD
jgi:hypothetical protein